MGGFLLGRCLLGVFLFGAFLFGGGGFSVVCRRLATQAKSTGPNRISTDNGRTEDATHTRLQKFQKTQSHDMYTYIQNFTPILKPAQQNVTHVSVANSCCNHVQGVIIQLLIWNFTRTWLLIWNFTSVRDSGSDCIIRATRSILF